MAEHEPILGIEGIRALARDAYAGWRGWHHDWNWCGDDVAVAELIQRQAVDEAAAMRAEIERLRDRIRQCQLVGEQAAAYVRVMRGEVSDG